MHGRRIVVEGRNFEWITAGMLQFSNLEEFQRFSQNGAFNGVIVWDTDNNRKQYKAPLNEVAYQDGHFSYPVLPSDVAAWIKTHVLEGK